MEVTHIYRNGQYLGSYSFDNGGGVCLTPQTGAHQVSQNENPEEPSTWKKISEFFQNLLFGSPFVGCGENFGPTAHQIQNNGVNMYPPDAGDINPENCYDSGACRIDGGVILPTDDASQVILPDDIWFEISGEGSFFQTTPPILLESGYLTGLGLKNLNLVVQIGTDSTRVPGMPVIDEDENGVPDNYFDGLINTNQLSEEDKANGEEGCPESGYESFAICPADPNNRLKVYIASVTLEGYRYVGGNYEKIGEVVDVKTNATNIDNLFTQPENAVVLPTVATPYEIDVPKEFHKSNELYLKVKITLIVDARQADRNAQYQTSLGVKITSKREE